jgi:hypothetical protein
MNKMYAYRLMDAFATVENIKSIQLDTLPANEAQARPLTQLEPAQQRQAWTQVIETTPRKSKFAQKERRGKCWHKCRRTKAQKEAEATIRGEVT